VRAIEHHGGRYSVAEAQRLVERIARTRQMYAGKAESVTLEREQLLEESGRVQAELMAVQAEQAEFEVQYASLVREIESLRRNNELIKLAEKRRGNRCDGHAEAMQTLDQVKSALERARIEQEERLKSLRASSADMGYEARARLNRVQEKQAKQVELSK
jgi:hypothetical protein